jgi:hypothetical protein
MMSNVIFPDESLSDTARAIVVDIRERQANDPRIGVSRKVTCEMLGVSATREIQLEALGELHSYLDGGSRRVLTSSIYGRLVKLAVASNPLGEPPATVRRPIGRYRSSERAPRARTPNELRGLMIANERRAEEARQRREARIQARSKAREAADVT